MVELMSTSANLVAKSYVYVTGLGSMSLPPFVLFRYTSTPFSLMSQPGSYTGL